jgi:hypothetical protein
MHMGENSDIGYKQLYKLVQFASTENDDCKNWNRASELLKI